MNIPGWLAGAFISLVVILLGNFVQSLVESYREKQQRRRKWYNQTASLAREIKQVYERRQQVAEDRQEENEDILDNMTSGVRNEIATEMLDCMDDLNAHLRTDFEIDNDVQNLIDQLDQKLIRCKREGIEDHIEDVVSICEQIDSEASRCAEKYETLL